MKERPVAFVTGATGFIGSHLVKRLLHESFETHILYRPSTQSTRINDILHKTAKHNVDICDEEALKKLLHKIRPDYIFHLANIGVYGGKESPDEDVVKTNLLGTASLLSASSKIPYKLFINTGSSSEYGPKNKAMKETDVCFPESMYGVTKLAGTLYARTFALKNKKPVLTLRLFSPYGPFDDPHRFISTIINQTLNGKKITLTNPKNVRDFVFIDDVIDAYISCVKSKKKLDGEIINIGSGKEQNIENILTIITKLIETKSRIITDSSIMRYESVVWQADITKAKKLLNWKPSVKLETGLRRTIVWHEQQNQSL